MLTHSVQEEAGHPNMVVRIDIFLRSTSLIKRQVSQVRKFRDIINQSVTRKARASPYHTNLNAYKHIIPYDSVIDTVFLA
jgi:hypothetical protein